MQDRTDFETQLQHWVVLDNQITQQNHQLKTLRESRDQLHDQIIEYMKKNQLTDTTIQISDGYLKYTEQSTPQPFTLKSIKQGLLQYFNQDEEKAERCLSFLKHVRNTKQQYLLKRVFS